MLGQPQLLPVPESIAIIAQRVTWNHAYRPFKSTDHIQSRETLIFPLPVLYSVLGKNSTRHIHEHPAIQTLVSLFEH